MQRTLQFLFLVSSVTLFLLPGVLWADGLVPCGGPGEPTCQTCHVGDLVNNVVRWLIAILTTVAAIIIAYAGFLLVTSGGNVNAKEKAKTYINNILIGYTLVLAGWLIIDTVIKSLLDDQKFGMWNTIACVDQPIAVRAQQVDIQLANTFGSIAVRDIDGNFTTINPQGGSTVTGGSCSVISNPANDCHPDNLSCFGTRASEASQICNIESGGNPRAVSGTDRCKDGRSFSGGLWQINILAHGNALGCNTSQFITYGSGPQGDCLERRTNSQGVSYCAVWNCEFRDASAYESCMGRIFNASTNTQFACSLYRSDGFDPWRISAGRCNISI